MNTTTPVFSAENVTLVRGGRRLLAGFCLNVAPGEAVHLTGPNGVGKSSILRMIGGGAWVRFWKYLAPLANNDQLSAA